MYNLVLKCFYVVVLLVSCVSVETNNYSENERVVVYYPTTLAKSEKYEIDFSEISHLNLWFFNPDIDGNFSARGNEKDIKKYIKKARKSGVKVYLSIGGGAVTESNDAGLFYLQIQNELNSTLFNQKILEMLDYYNVDGIDLDIEGNVVTENYSQIIVELSKVLKNNGYGLTGAFNYYSGRKISDEAINCFDMINVMSYNESGLWEPHLRDHSTFEDSQKHLNYWVETRKIAPEKIVLGVPFYGWFKTFDLDDNLLNQGSITYDKISNFFPYIDNSNDWLELQTKNSKTEITFNNIDAIKNKRLLAREYGGIMIWQYIQDTKERTLFNTIINN